MADKYKITIDTNLLMGDSKHSSVQTLKRWRDEGKIEIVETEPAVNPREPAYGWPGAPPKPVTSEKNPWGGTSRGRPKKKMEGPKFRDVASVLMPGRNADKLNRTEVNDVMHLMKHHGTKNEIFVTGNLKDFIDGGRRELLKNWFQITVMTAEEAVSTLASKQGWK